MFTGFQIARESGEFIILHQHGYLKGHTLLPEDVRYSDFTSTKMKLARLSHSRPDCTCKVSQLTQNTIESLEEDCHNILRRTNKVVKYAELKEISLRFVKMSLISFKIDGFSDALLASSGDLTSQLSYILLAAD